MARWNRSKESADRHQKLRRRIAWGVGLLVSFYLLVPLLVGDMGIVKYFELRRTHHQLQQEIQQLSDENQKIQDEIHALWSDPAKIEQLAREKLGLVRPGEVVYQFQPASPVPSPSDPPAPRRP
ncbi:MAG: septum formation initiator family protein [Nitrospirae bacterium]|nr:septum formation initiator family protein [Nitrospirota bacterium]